MAQHAGGIFVFEADNADFKNRKRAARACASCQKRKKRCSHTFSGPPDQQAEKESAEKVLPQLAHKEPLKFVGDLNPESVLKTLTTGEKDSPRYSQIGVWVEQSRLEKEVFRREQEVAAQNGTTPAGTAADGDDAARKKQTAVQKYSKIERGRRTLTGHQKNYLQAVGALRVLPKDTQDALVGTYVSCLDPLLPIIDCERMLLEYKMGVASVFLIQAICLVACKTPEAVPFLRLYEDGPLMDAIPFARSLHTGLDAAMKADLEADRFTKVQIMTLMSLHNDGPGGIEEGSLHLVMAIHDAQTTGLHIRTPGRTPNDQAAMLWWTLWTLDKFNACLGGRPLMIADRDIDIGRPEPADDARSQAMMVWLALGKLLDEVIEYYRPITDPHIAGWENPFPSFEETIEGCRTNHIEPAHMNLLELCYNIIGILACRAGGPTSKSYQRRIACAGRIQQLTIKGSDSSLPPLPLVPYGISLSLTVAYRGLRDSQSDPEQVTSDLAARCNILESLSKTWWTADAMAKLGRKALRSIQQPAPPQPPQTPHKASAGLAAIGDALEAEVTPCKYGPFDNMRKSDPQSLKNKIGLGVLTGGKDGAHPAAGAVGTRSESFNSKDGKDNGLQLLSDAAARHRSKTPQDRLNSNANDHPMVGQPMVNHHPLRSLRYDMIPPTPAAPTPTPFFNTNTSHDSPATATAILSPNAATLSATGPATPFSTTNTNPQSNPHPSSSHSHLPDATGTFNINPAIDPFCATFPPGIPINISTSDDFQYGFNDLDNLFEGFFDLSMPTMFQDPIYEGAAYNDFSGFGSSGNSVDYSQNNGYDTTMGGMGTGQTQRG